MTTIRIGGNETDLAHASASWIRDQVRALRSRGMPVCVQVSIHSGPDQCFAVDASVRHIQSPGREPNIEERRILDLWHKRGMRSDDFDVGQLIAFANEIKHV